MEKAQPKYVFTLKRKASSDPEQLVGRPVKVAKVEMFEDASIRVKKTAKGFTVEIDQVEVEQERQQFENPSTAGSYNTGYINNDDNSSSSSSCSGEILLNKAQFVKYARVNSEATTTCDQSVGSLTNGIESCRGCASVHCTDCMCYKLSLQYVGSVKAAYSNEAYSNEEDDEATEVLHTPAQRAYYQVRQ